MEISLQLSNSTRMKKPSVIPRFLSRRDGRQVKIILACRHTKINAMKDNFYEVLSLRSENAGVEEIKRAYRCMALQWHPDVCHHSDKEESTRRFVQLREAYETLSDPVSREIYDHELGLITSFDGDEFAVRRSRPPPCMENRRRSVFAREVWERQLSGLKARSRRRMENRNSY
ncbi:PREDICTED: chaperone protein dnaJ 20, chloroplastic-like [Ipomoea nil]|uniref:chaperone protein dnaJ 20, chloroplastic-like n=1 Tax=Ipomoea nil TaxID=35883 RepID=UPI00090125DF|nr:PREDICTED: chaperone protein dnaJ 20, chloroplastic-like [Ipomoea nil]